MALHMISNKRKTLGVKAYQVIRDEIICLRLKPGEMIYENAVSELLGVSRTPVREAFNMLLQDELIEILPQRGARVAFISEQKVIEAQFVRESLEISTFKQVADLWDPKKIKFQEFDLEINNILHQQEVAVENKDYTQFISLDGEFHEQILSVPGNRTVLMVMNKMRAHLNRMRYLELQEAHHEKGAIAQHKEIFEAIKNNDAAQTERLLISHLRMLEEVRPEIIKKYSEFFG